MNGDCNQLPRILWLSAICLALSLNASLGQSLKHLRRQAEQGDARAQYLLGRRYEQGDAVRESAVKAAKWYRKAAEQGLAAAQYNLGRMYASGLGLRQDYTEALRWFRKAAAQNYALAHNRLGVMYENGLGVAQEHAEAYKWYILAAGENGNVFGIANRDVLAQRITADEIADGERRAAASEQFAVADSD